MTRDRTSRAEDEDLNALFAALEKDTSKRKPVRLRSMPTDALLELHRWNIPGLLDAPDQELVRRAIPPSLWPWPSIGWAPCDKRRIQADHMWLKKRLRRRPAGNSSLRNFLGWTSTQVAGLTTRYSQSHLVAAFGLSERLQGECSWLRAPDLDRRLQRLATVQRLVQS